MRNPDRIDKVLEVLGACWKKYPDWRLGQLFCNLQRATGTDLFYLEDNKMIELLNEYFEMGDERSRETDDI